MGSTIAQQLERIFNPGSIAVVGASAQGVNVGSRWVEGLVSAGFGGDIYPVNPRGGQISGLKVYPDLMSIPGTVDYVIVAIPRRFVLDLLRDCRAKEVKAVQFFTAGFSETGEEVGIKLEREMLRFARESGFRIIGPNCVGIYCPANKIPYGPSKLLGRPGKVALISQSGGHGGRLVESGIARGLHFSKGVSFGNGYDLDSSDYLEYFATDPETEVIGAYLEGTRDGRRLFNVLKKISPNKPLVVWKGGRTEIGAKNAASHTGSLAIPYTLWRVAMRQAGAIIVESLDEMVDTLIAFQDFSPLRGEGIAIISGLVDGGGGDAVSAADFFADSELSVPSFSTKTEERLRHMLSDVGCILRNPLDIGGSGSNFETFGEILNVIATDPRLDILLVVENMQDLVSLLPPGKVFGINELLIRFKNEKGKPVVVVMSPGLAEGDRLKVEKKLSDVGIPVYPSLERAARALANLIGYFKHQAGYNSVSPAVNS